MSKLSDLLAGKSLMLSDGAWGTQLMKRGLQPGQAPDPWNLDKPEPVRQVAKAYVDAGSNIILTNTFGGTRIQLARHNESARTAAINTAGVQISKQAAGSKAFVFASMGPCGKMMMMGEISADEVSAAFVEQANAIKAGGADGIVVESFTDLDEIELATRAAAATGLPVVASLTYDSGPDHTRTMMGTTPEQAAERLGPAGATIIGANCGIGIDNYILVARKYKAVWKGPIWIKANAGMPEMVNGKTTYNMKPEVFGQRALELVDAGATIVGGCCGTGPEFITALRTSLIKAGKLKA
ncbi:MAG: homocysteine S-methyltransferase family protein [Phycisphaerae bacterium]|nr:homocysteine S-methyltransferase family protein [Phycisphaerae bacterium]